nr:hypothetical protein [uncultured Blautia sp.]
MKILGIHFTIKNGKKSTTLHLEEDFDQYFKAEDGTRGCAGKRVESVYVGVYDCSKLKVGDEIEIYYGRMQNVNSGKPFQTIKKIEKLN